MLRFQHRKELVDCKYEFENLFRSLIWGSTWNPTENSIIHVHTHQYTQHAGVLIYQDITSISGLTCVRLRLLSTEMGIRKGRILLASASFVIPSLLSSRATLWMPVAKKNSYMVINVCTCVHTTTQNMHMCTHTNTYDIHMDSHTNTHNMHMCICSRTHTQFSCRHGSFILISKSYTNMLPNKAAQVLVATENFILISTIILKYITMAK